MQAKAMVTESSGPLGHRRWSAILAVRRCGISTKAVDDDGALIIGFRKVPMISKSSIQLMSLNSSVPKHRIINPLP